MQELSTVRLRVLAVLATLIVYGCATVTKEEALAFGSIEVLQGQPSQRGVVLAAPHGTADCNTGVIVKNLALDLGIPAVIATRFSRKETGDRRINVNRPTEGAGLYFNDETWTPRAAHVWQEYRRLVLESGGQRFALYIEIHCNTHPATGGMIEVATKGVSRDQAVVLKRLYYQARDRIVPEGTPRVDLKMEPVDKVYMSAYGAKTHGAMSLAPVAIHIEIPGPVTNLAARENAPYRRVLASFLRDAVANLE
jgi:hypothetical protein